MRNKLLIISCLTLIPTFLLSQNFNSPYSVYGFGEIQDTEFANLASVEPLGLTEKSKSSYSLQNPASYSTLNFTTFDIGLAGKLYQYQGDNYAFEDERINFGYLALGFPLMKEINWGASFGLIPVSQIGFNYSDEFSDPQEYRLVNNGKGGLSKFYIGTGIEVFKGFKVGLNGAYLFGNKDRFETYQFQDRTPLRSRTIVNETVGGFIFEGGLQYEYNLNKEMALVAGISGRVPRTINFSRTEETFAYPYSPDETLAGLLDQGIADTVGISNQEGKMKFPGNYKASVELRKKNSWRLGLGFDYGQWSEFAIMDRDQGLSDAYEVNLAGQLTHDKKGSSFWELVDYRFGIKYANSYLKPTGDPLERYEANLGIGFPLYPDPDNPTSGRDQRSAIDLSLAFGTLGKKEGPLWRENYMKFKLGFSLTENWFIEQKLK